MTIGRSRVVQNAIRMYDTTRTAMKSVRTEKESKIKQSIVKQNTAEHIAYKKQHHRMECNIIVLVSAYLVEQSQRVLRILHILDKPLH